MPPKKKTTPNPDHVIKLGSKDYITHAGLLDLATKAGLMGSKTDPVFELCDPSKNRYVYKAKVWDADGREFEGSGDADPSNLGSQTKNAALRMAGTRALNRALRQLVNRCETTAD